MLHHQSVEPSELSIEILHASVIRAMSVFVQEPRPEIAETIVRLLGALACHPERFQPQRGHDVYPLALDSWRDVLLRMGGQCRFEPSAVVH